ncbi:MAG TPA: hypothetical protein ENK44_16515 [Caldithrix abyssi]|uniref:Uncharacterized protein n=1 Tax=Caldithrix abyssi TaxID=187145 RepID=A0A7V4U429_CALAY|nr:hypothetical protein [Caldithrix abyssi]
MEQDYLMTGLPVHRPEEYELLLEALRTRINVLNASVFLLKDSMNNNDLKSMEYINRINLELERIRRLLNQTPEKIISQKTKNQK